MKKLINLLAIVTLASTSVSNVNTIINNNLKQQSINKINDVLLPNSSEITGYTSEIKNYKIDLDSNVFFTTNNKIYKVNAGTTNAVEITKFNNGVVVDLILDSQSNFYFTIKTSDEENKLYKVNVGTTNAVELNGYIGTSYSFFFDSKNNLYFYSEYKNGSSLNNKFYKVNVGTTNAVEITDIGNGKFKNFTFDSKNNLYFTNESNLFIFDSEKHHYQLTDFKGNIEYIFFTFDSKNNLYFGIKNNDETIDLYKQLYDEQKLIKIDYEVQNYEFTWKEQDNINFDNENNLYYVKKNNNEQLSIFYLKNNELKSQLIFSFNKIAKL